MRQLWLPLPLVPEDSLPCQLLRCEHSIGVGWSRSQDPQLPSRILHIVHIVILII
ncbi:hypothetical protein J6590_071560 [Homalodisca vitripennis]|nr:hypothetical protein J6590_071560 [Homalodisca vitripennis]